MITQDDERTTPPDRAVADCTAVIVTYNSGRDISALLDSLPAAAGGLSLRTIVIDNGSTDDTTARVREHAEVTLIETGANVGYAAAINVGRAHARPCRSILVLNPDVRLAAGAIPILVDAAGTAGAGVAVPALVDGAGRRHRSLRRDPTVVRALGEALLGDHLPHRPAWAAEVVRDDDAYEQLHTVDWATGAVLLISDDCDRAVGPWDESFFLYSEEVDHAMRARSAGFGIVFVPGAVALHHEGGSGASDDLVALMAVNRVRHHRKHHGRAAAGAFRGVMILHAVVRLPRSGQRAALAALAGRPRSPWLRAVLDGGRPPR